MPSLTIVFAGSPEAAVPSLRRIAASEHTISAVLTREDSPQGRRGTLTPTPVALAADELGLPVIRANRLAGPATEAIGDIQPDLGVIVAYGGLVRAYRLSELAEHVSGVELRDELEHGRTRQVIPRDDRALHRRGPSPARQKREVQVDPAEARNLQSGRRDQRAVRDDGDAIGR